MDREQDAARAALLPVLARSPSRIVGQDMKLMGEGQPGGLEALAEQAVVAACALADAAGLGEWSPGAVEDAATALEVLAGALARLDPQCADILAAVQLGAVAVPGVEDGLDREIHLLARVLREV
ncbi:hypothetical protein ACE14D_14900, partial [Streptomyces sp. Act-28]